MKKVKKIIRFINKLALLGATLTSLLYILYIVAISVITYLHNRPIRTAVLCLAFGVIMMALDTIEDKQGRRDANKQKDSSTDRHKQDKHKTK